jgi:hypothetical protein
MPKIIIKLSKEEELELQYKIYQYQGLQINFNLFLQSGREFNEDHYNRLIDTLLEKYTALQSYIINLLVKNGYKNNKIINYDITVPEGTLIIESR